jgi:hypothetical protein
MKKNDIKRHLTNYSIFSKRRSTINHAFASALSIADKFDSEKIDIALKILGQDNYENLLCAYCDKEAQTWDHIKAVVEKGQFSGYGHQLNNLLPCCKDCNSAKGNKDWQEFLKQRNLDSRERIDRITAYINHNYVDIKSVLKNESLKNDLMEFEEIKTQVLELLKKADEKAKEIKDKVNNSKENNNC